MLKEVALKTLTLDAYRDIVLDPLFQDIEQAGKALAGIRVTHVNATPYGGGVAEMLKSMLPLMRDAGLDARWQVLDVAGDRLFRITKQMHNALQGASESPAAHDLEIYLDAQRKIAAALDRIDTDLLVIHDPQPLGSFVFMKKRVPAVLRIHIDMMTPNERLERFLRPYMQQYDALVFSLRKFAPEWAEPGKVHVIPPAIDPLTEKNVPLDEERARTIVEGFGIDPRRPIMTQISRFDIWKDPIGVIDAYRMVKREIPDCQLVLAGSAAKDDPESVMVFGQVAMHVEGDPDIHLLTDVTDVEVNALQVASDVIVQKSLKEGFGLTVTEAMWKGQPVVGGDVGGIRLQIDDGVNGRLVQTVRGCADAVVALLRFESERERMGLHAAETVAARFLIPRLVKDHLGLYRTILGR